jgi:hypothetical protein
MAMAGLDTPLRGYSTSMEGAARYSTSLLRAARPRCRARSLLIE